ncbi:MAG TPA: copper chaperone PCu(A)C [Steroidobacteraceae bacterium]
MNRRSTIALLVVSLFAAGPALAGELTVTDAWSRTTPPGVTVGVVYFKIHNDTAKSDRLLKLKASVASSVQVHRTEVIEGVARMRDVAVLHVAPGERVAFEPGGMHVMLMGLKKPLVEGQKFDLELLFEVAGPRKVRVVIKKP